MCTLVWTENTYEISSKSVTKIVGAMAFRLRTSIWLLINDDFAFSTRSLGPVALLLPPLLEPDRKYVTGKAR